MAFEDIGYMLFARLLGMSEYPGQPFTGDIMRDLIMFFLVPSVFIILVLYMAVGRVLHSEHRQLRILLGVSAYLFIIAGGYYRTFALLAGPWFLVLIFVLGILFFFFEHFTRRGGVQGGAGPMSRSNLGEQYYNIAHTDDIGALRVQKSRLEDALKRAQADVNSIEKKADTAMSHGRDARVYADRLGGAARKRDEIDRQVKEIDMRIEELTARGALRKAARRFG